MCRHGVVALAEPAGKLPQKARQPANLELAAKAADRTPARSPLAYEDDPGILVQWTPVDLALPAMAEPPERLRQILEDAGVRTRVQGELPQLVHFKPNRRAVLRYGDHFVKIYADDKAYERAVAGMLAADALPMRSARCDAAIPDLRLTAQSFVEGAPPAGPVEAAPAAGAFLAMLHGTPNDTVRVTPPSHRLESATASARLLASIEPRLEQRLRGLLRRLEESMPDEPLVLSHGDFHARQMLELDGDYGVIDFDASCRAPAALDMATYISSLVRGLDDLPAGMAALDVLGEAYGRTAGRRSLVPDLRAAAPRLDPVSRLPRELAGAGRGARALRGDGARLMTRPSAENVRGAIPRDERLPQIAVLLDADAMALTLARSLGRDDPLGPVDVRYIRYRPGKNLCVHYVVDVDGAEQHAVAMASSKYDLSLDAADPVYDARIALVAGRTPAARPLLYDADAQALLQWLPFDIDMPALAEPASALRERLAACGVDIPVDRAELTLLQYRPRRRAALRLGDHVVKVYRYEQDFSDGVAGLEAARRLGGLRTAQGEAVVDDLRLTVQEWLPGAPPARRAEFAREAGEVLRELHGHEARRPPAAAPVGAARGGRDRCRDGLVDRPVARATCPERIAGARATGARSGRRVRHLAWGLPRRAVARAVRRPRADRSRPARLGAAGARSRQLRRSPHPEGRARPLGRVDRARGPRRGLRQPAALARVVPRGLDPAPLARAVPQLRARLAGADGGHGRRGRGRPPAVIDRDLLCTLLEPLLGAPVELEMLKEKPGRRATMRARGSRRSAIVKVYASQRAATVAARIRGLAGGPDEPIVPEVLLLDEALHLVVLSEVPGVPLTAR